MKKKLGFSLVEILMVTAVAAMVAIGSSGILVSVLKSYEYTGTQLAADVQTSAAVQQMARDLQEAKQVTILSPTSMRVYYPQKNADGTYSRALDSAHTIDFYRADTHGPNSLGTLLVRLPAGGLPRTLCKGVLSVAFTSPNPTSVDVSVKANRTYGSVVKECDMVHRAIFLRNY